MADLTNSNENWFTREHLTACVLDYLKENGYKTYKEETILSGMPETILFAFGNGQKEIIEIKGYYESGSSPRQQLIRAASPEQSGPWFPDTLLSSLTSLVKQYKNDRLPVSLCLPDLARYREIIEKVREYFTHNNLHHKIYLVGENGTVTRLNLNRSEQMSNAKTSKMENDTFA